MMLVEPQTVIAQLVDQFPGIEVLGISADRDLGLEMTAGEGVGQFGAGLQMVELFAISQQIKDKNFHGRVPVRCGKCVGSERRWSTVRVAPLLAMTIQCHNRSDASFAPSTREASFWKAISRSTRPVLPTNVANPQLVPARSRSRPMLA